MTSTARHANNSTATRADTNEIYQPRLSWLFSSVELKLKARAQAQLSVVHLDSFSLPDWLTGCSIYQLQQLDLLFDCVSCPNSPIPFTSPRLQVFVCFYLRFCVCLFCYALFEFVVVAWTAISNFETTQLFSHLLLQCNSVLFLFSF